MTCESGSQNLRTELQTPYKKMATERLQLPTVQVYDTYNLQTYRKYRLFLTVQRLAIFSLSRLKGTRDSEWWDPTDWVRY